MVIAIDIEYRQSGVDTYNTAAEITEIRARAKSWGREMVYLNLSQKVRRW